MYEKEIKEILEKYGYPHGRNKLKVLIRREFKRLEKQGKVWGFAEKLNFENWFIWNAIVIDKSKLIDMSRFYEFQIVEVSK